MKLLRYFASSLLILYSLLLSAHADSQCESLTVPILDASSLQISLKSLTVGNSYYDGEFSYISNVNGKWVWKLLTARQQSQALPAGCQSKASLTRNSLVLSIINTSNNSGKYSATFELVQQGADYFLILKDYTQLNNNSPIDDLVIPPFNPNAPFPGLIAPVLDALIPDVPKLAEYRDAALTLESAALNKVVSNITTKSANAKKLIAKSWGTEEPGVVAALFVNLAAGFNTLDKSFTGSKTETMPDNSGSLSVTFTADGKTTTELSTKIAIPILLMQGNSKVALTGSVCPDVSGKVEFSVKFSSEGQAGSDGAIQYGQNLEAKVKANLDDDANLINSEFEVKQAYRSASSSGQNYRESSLSAQTTDPSHQFTNISQTGTGTNDDVARGLGLALIPLKMAQSFWEGGGCIEINATSPGKVAPGATSKIPVSVKHKQDGSSVPAKVTVELAGGASVQPAVIKPTPGDISHVATSERDAEMTITLKATSRRGKATKELKLTTKEAPTYKGTIEFKNNADTHSITGNIDVTWSLIEDVDGIRKYLPSGTLNADVKLSDCDPLHATLPIPNQVGNMMVVYTENAVKYKNTYQLQLVGFVAYPLTFMCSTPRQPLTLNGFMFELLVGGCQGFEYHPFTNEGFLEGVYNCSGLGISSNWGFTASPN